jgi:hypothetical protein
MPLIPPSEIVEPLLVSSSSTQPSPGSGSVQRPRRLRVPFDLDLTRPDGDTRPRHLRCSRRLPTRRVSRNLALVLPEPPNQAQLPASRNRSNRFQIERRGFRRIHAREAKLRIFADDQGLFKTAAAAIR